MTAPALRSPLSEKDFLTQVVALAVLRGWLYLHLRPGMTRDSWRTPISGPLGQGWVDLLLIRVRDGRLIFAELKREDGKLSREQANVIAILRDLPEWAEVYVWRPSDWPEIMEVLA